MARLSPARGDWSTQQLVEFLAVVSSSPDEGAAIRAAVERAADAMGADFGALVRDGVAIGVPEGGELERAVLALAADDHAAVETEALGTCQGMSVPLEWPPSGRLVVGRVGSPFSADELSVLTAMGRVLALTLDQLRRRRLLECVSEVQHLISARKPLQEVLDAITAGAAELTATDIAGLRLVDPEDAGQLVMPALSGLAAGTEKLPRRTPVGLGAGGRAYVERRLVVIDDYAADAGAIAQLADTGVTAAMAAPVSEDGTVVGSLAVASRTPGRSFGEVEQQALVAFAEHASLALTDAKTVDQMREALHDPLTGLPSRSVLLERLDRACAEARRAGTLVAAVFIDLDRFKLVNDSYGHATGDELLVAVAARIRGELRGTDTLARLGGDEFVVVAEGLAAPVDGMEIGERLVAALDEPFHLGKRDVYIGSSAGVALGDGSEEPEELLRGADTAMHRAKQEAASAYELFEPEMRSVVADRIELEADLRRAIENEELSVAYQPIVEISSGRLVGFEALARWIHAERGFVSPGDFIPLAEETGLVVPLGRWVLDTACRQLAEWNLPGLMMSVNISGVQLRRPEFVADALRIIAEHRVAAGDVMLEITETVIMQNTEAAVARLHELRSLGFLLGIDDFGTGYSSLHYVRHFPVHVLKIAKPFVDDVADGGAGAAVATAVAQLGQSLGLRMIAEGIEHADQREALEAMGCDLGQGYHFCRPVDPAAAGELVAEHAADAARAA